MPRPIGDQEFDTKVATAGDAAAMGTALTAHLAIPVKIIEGSEAGKWKLSETPSSQEPSRRDGPTIQRGLL